MIERAPGSSRRRLPKPTVGGAANWADDRLAGARPLRKLFNKVFPDHWSFMLGEIALYSFIVLLLSGRSSRCSSRRPRRT